MAGYIYPILQAFQAVFRATINKEKDLIDSSLVDVKREWVVIENFENSPEECPWIQVWQVPNENELNAPELMGDKIVPQWNVITTCIVQADTDEELIKSLDVYLKAMLFSAVKSTDDDFWNLDGEADFLIPESITFTNPFQLEESGKTFLQGAILWTVDKEELIS